MNGRSDTGKPVSRWTLTAVFDSIEEAKIAEVYEGGPSEAARFYSRIQAHWCTFGGLDEAQFRSVASLADDTVTANADTFDELSDPLSWLLFHTVPKSFTVTRNEPRRRPR